MPGLNLAPGPAPASAKITRAWYVACEGRALASKPLSATILATPLVLFRDAEGRPAALLDRCAHRNVPLSLGRVENGRVECAYHGWRFGSAGDCVAIPGLCGSQIPPAARVPGFTSREQDGLVWVWMDPASSPDQEPFRLPDLGPGYTTVLRRVQAEAPLHATLENALDVPHTAFLHRGLFRGARKPRRIGVRVRRIPGGIEAEYLGEPRPAGLAARLLSPSGGTVSHHDRFLLPSIAQVEYRLGTESHFLVSALCTPIEDFQTAIHAAVSFRTLLPGRLLRWVMTPVALKIFGQDARILKAQTASVKRFGSERFVSSPADVLGLQISQLLKAAAEGRPDPEPAWSRELTLEV